MRCVDNLFILHLIHAYILLGTRKFSVMISEISNILKYVVMLSTSGYEQSFRIDVQQFLEQVEWSANTKGLDLDMILRTMPELIKGRSLK